MDIVQAEYANMHVPRSRSPPELALITDYSLPNMAISVPNQSHMDIVRMEMDGMDAKPQPKPNMPEPMNIDGSEVMPILNASIGVSVEQPPQDDQQVPQGQQPILMAASSPQPLLRCDPNEADIQNQLPHIPEATVWPVEQIQQPVEQMPVGEIQQPIEQQQESVVQPQQPAQDQQPIVDENPQQQVAMQVDVGDIAPNVTVAPDITAAPNVTAAAVNV